MLNLSIVVFLPLGYAAAFLLAVVGARTAHVEREVRRQIAFERTSIVSLSVVSASAERIIRIGVLFVYYGFALVSSLLYVLAVATAFQMLPLAAPMVLKLAVGTAISAMWGLLLGGTSYLVPLVRESLLSEWAAKRTLRFDAADGFYFESQAAPVFVRWGDPYIVRCVSVCRVPYSWSYARCATWEIEHAGRVTTLAYLLCDDPSAPSGVLGDAPFIQSGGKALMKRLIDRAGPDSAPAARAWAAMNSRPAKVTHRADPAN